MEIDHRTIRAMSAQTRLRMLKSLKSRKKMPSELSKEIGLSPSTVVEHLRNLEGAGLIKRIETGHKWVYYELTEKGVNIIQPRMPVQFALTLLAGILMTSFGFLGAMYPGTTFAGVQKSAASEAITAVPKAGISEVGAGNIAQSMPVDWISVLILAIGLVLIIFSLYMLLKKR